ncbi:hypothetical protein [Microbacterium sp.]|uniref:hypothetical protein n=1 Tax=Microbacterium sp. TaxID=51671 RepID=UPI003A939DE3
MASIESIRRTAPDRASRRARIAVSALFLTNGALFANILPRYPEIKAGLGLDNLGYGFAIAAFPAGAIAAGLLAAVLIRRFGSARIAVIGTVLTSIGLLSAALAPSGCCSPSRCSSAEHPTPSRMSRRTPRPPRAAALRTLDHQRIPRDLVDRRRDQWGDGRRRDRPAVAPGCAPRHLDRRVRYRRPRGLRFCLPGRDDGSSRMPPPSRPR